MHESQQYQKQKMIKYLQIEEHILEEFPLHDLRYEQPTEKANSISGREKENIWKKI